MALWRQAASGAIPNKNSYCYSVSNPTQVVGATSVMTINRHQHWKVLIGILTLALVAFSIDSILIQQKLSGLSAAIGRQHIKKLVITYYPVLWMSRLPISAGSFHDYDAETARIIGIKERDISDFSSSKIGADFRDCLDNTEFSRSFLQLNPFYPDLRVELIFYDSEMKEVQALYLGGDSFTLFNSEYATGQIGNQRGVFSGCLLSFVKHHLLEVE